MATGYYGQQLQRANSRGPYLRDYTHASKTFTTNNYQYAPKVKFLFHVYFDINREAYNQNVETGDNFALAVKTVRLPSFTIQTQELNQYNRKRIIQTKIKYDPVEITFHDDTGNMITKLWEAYYTYYFQDGRNYETIFKGSRGALTNASNAGGGQTAGSNNSYYNRRNIYDPIISNDNNWGYIGGPKLDIPFFKNITVFGLYQHKFTAYTLINPMITKFSHDTYSYVQGGETMEMNMSLDYETVVYNEGDIDGQNPDNIITGFGLQQNYDRNLSPSAPKGSNGLSTGKAGYNPSFGGSIQSLDGGSV